MKNQLLFYLVFAVTVPCCQGQILKKLREKAESAVEKEITDIIQKDKNNENNQVINNDHEFGNTNSTESTRPDATPSLEVVGEDVETVPYNSDFTNLKSFRILAHQGLPRIGAVKHSGANNDIVLTAYKQYYSLLKLRYFDPFFEDIDREIPDISFPWTTEKQKNSALAQLVLKEAALANLTEEAKFVYFCDSDNSNCGIDATRKSKVGKEVSVKYNPNIWGGGNKFREVRIYQKFVSDGNIENLRQWADKLFRNGQNEVYIVANSSMGNYNIKEQKFALQLRLPHNFSPAYTPIDIQYQLKSGANFGYAEFQDVVFEHSDNILRSLPMKAEDAEKLISENTRGGYRMGRENINVFLGYRTRITFNKLEYPGQTPSKIPIVVMDIEMLSPEVDVYLDDFLTKKIGRISLLKQ